MNNKKIWTAFSLVCAVIWHPTYKILLCADTVIPPSPWTDNFDVVVDNQNKVIRLTGDFT